MRNFSHSDSRIAHPSLEEKGRYPSLILLSREALASSHDLRLDERGAHSEMLGMSLTYIFSEYEAAGACMIEDEIEIANRYRSAAESPPLIHYLLNGGKGRSARNRDDSAPGSPRGPGRGIGGQLGLWWT